MNDVHQAGACETDPALAACLFAVDPIALGGLSVRMRAGPEREQFLAMARGLMQPERPFRRLPLNIDDSRLLGGLDLAATLQSGRPIFERGLLADTDGGVLIVPMAERVPKALAGRLAAALDTGELAVERDGFGVNVATQLAIIALDESLDDDEPPPAALLDRIAIHLHVANIHDGSLNPPFSTKQIDTARIVLPKVRVREDIARVLCCVAVQFGIESIRAPLLALAVARLHAALAGRLETIDEDAVAAARLVLAPRATMLPAAQEEPGVEPEQDSEAESPPSERDKPDQQTPQDVGKLDDVVLAATMAAIPPGVLAKLQTMTALGARRSAQGRAGMARQAAHRGRAIGSRRGDIKVGPRLSLVDTLRNAAPWQAVRRRESVVEGCGVAVRREDFRVVRYKQRSETATVFVVDASGSSAMHRMAEAKGAIELLLADCYIRRDQVALIAFRGAGADLILPPTRSLTRAKRVLAALPAGGGTPLAAAIDAGGALADTLRRKGVSPTLVFLTDGRANVGRDASGGRERAQDEAYRAARACRSVRLSTLVVDTSPQPGPAAERLALEIGGHYLPLPHADAADISRAIRHVTPAPKAAMTL